MIPRSITYQVSQFTVLSISYEKADAITRGRFAFFDDHIKSFVNQIHNDKLGDAFVVSTCNRTEIYTTTQNYLLIAELYCKTIGVGIVDFMNFVSVKKGNEALDHLFRVSAGLESQILGDFEIISQIKNAFNRFKEYKNQPNAFLERAINTAIQVSKKIKNQTGISSGAASVSYAAVHYILENQENISDKNILLLGVGEIGQNTIENLLKHVKSPKVKIANRTFEKAEKISKKYKIPQINFEEWQQEIETTDILIVATGARKPVVLKEHFPTKPIMVIDLSIPNNVDKSAMELDNISLVDVDFLSSQITHTLDQRKQEIPKAENIIKEMIKVFLEEEKKRKLAPDIHQFKSDLLSLEKKELTKLEKKVDHIEEEDLVLTKKLIQKITNRFAKYIVENPQKSEEITKLFHNILTLNENENH